MNYDDIASGKVAIMGVEALLRGLELLMLKL
jgi:hypothetical protein